MGTKMGPSYANLFVGYIGHNFFYQYHGPKPELYRRYIDDCVGATSSTREELNQFKTAVNSFHPALKAGVHLKAVFWLGIMFLMQISRLRFKQSRICSLITHIYVLRRFVNFLVILNNYWMRFL